MSNKVKIAIDAMSGENAPNKIIEGIEISLKSSQENFFYLFGQKDLLEKKISKNKLIQKYCEIINTKDIILDDESPLGAAKRGKDSSMWKAIESLKEKKSLKIKLCKNIVRLLTPKILFWMRRVHSVLLKEEKSPACGKL